MRNWIEIGALNDIPRLGSRVVRTKNCEIAVFRTENDDVFALHDQCPHQHGALSQGIVHGNRVTCPLHNWVISLEDGEAQGRDTGCTRTFNVKLDGDTVLLEV